MSIYSREALLQLRESPLVATAAPDLPSWISSEAIEKAQKEPRVSARTNGGRFKHIVSHALTGQLMQITTGSFYESRKVDVNLAIRIHAPHLTVYSNAAIH
jgi:hypothetical protein